MSRGNSKLNQLRNKHPQFIYQDFEFKFKNQNLYISHNFLLKPNINFQTSLKILNLKNKKTCAEQSRSINKNILNNLIFNLGLAEMASYWKAACPREIVINVGNADLRFLPINFWHNLLIRGLGEFFYINNIDFTGKDFIKITSQGGNTNQGVLPNQPGRMQYAPTGQNILIPIGGGKDSLVSLEILKQNNQNNIILFALNPNQNIKNIIKLNQDLPVIIAERKIDPELLKLNQKKYFNGHTPFSSYLAFLTTLVAYLFDIKYIALSNEASANEACLSYHGHQINHQYSKSYDFEEKFQNLYNQNYFSFLRPLSELQIAKIFSSYDQYFNIFKSCNSQISHWCGQCPKCVFAFLILYPFLPDKKIIKIFGQNLFDSLELWPIFLELIGYSNKKPLDCVGTHEESLVALFLSYQKVKQNNKRLSKILKKFENLILIKEKNLNKRAQKILTSYNTHNSLPQKFDKILKIYVKQI